MTRAASGKGGQREGSCARPNSSGKSRWKGRTLKERAGTEGKAPLWGMLKRGSQQRVGDGVCRGAPPPPVCPRRPLRASSPLHRLRSSLVTSGRPNQSPARPAVRRHTDKSTGSHPIPPTGGRPPAGTSAQRRAHRPAPAGTRPRARRPARVATDRAGGGSRRRRLRDVARPPAAARLFLFIFSFTEAAPLPLSPPTHRLASGRRRVAAAVGAEGA